MIRSLGFVLSIALFAISPVSAASDCAIGPSDAVSIPKNSKDRRDTTKKAYRLADGSIVFLGRFTIDADGHPRAYGPRDIGLDHLGNAGKPGEWWALATSAPGCGPSGRPLLQGAGEPAPGFYVSKTTMTAGGDCRRQNNYVDSGRIPYVALPRAIARIVGNRGVLAAVHDPRTNRTALAIHADAAPRFGIGEGSMALARELGLRESPRSGGLRRRDLVYVVLPNATRSPFPRSASAVTATAGSAFAAWGGNGRLARCAEKLGHLPK